ncbi:MAG: GxxExxY protein, partial [Ferruginibacter sp.]
SSEVLTLIFFMEYKYQILRKVLSDVHLAQALNYLEAFNLEVGLLINFCGKSLEVKSLFNKKYKLSNQDHQ